MSGKDTLPEERFYIRLGDRRGEGSYVKTYAGGSVTITGRRSHALWWRDRELAHRLAVAVVEAVVGNARVIRSRSMNLRKGKNGMKIYVASSWRNLLQPAIVHALRRCGHEVYDFKNPAPGNKGFVWSSIDPNWKNWTPEEYRKALQHSIAVEGYGYDIAALKACDACVLVLPSGRSASWEMGYAMGQGKRGAVVQLDGVEPELMYREAEILTSMNELFDAFALPGTDLAPAAFRGEDASRDGT